MSVHDSAFPRAAVLPPNIRHLKPTRGRWIGQLLNLVLRVTVKWQQGLRIDISGLRRQMDKQNRLAARRALGVERKPVRCGGVAAEELTPASSQTGRVLLYIHGGAFVVRTPDLHAAMVSQWCRALNVRAIMVDYRLAPEHPYPAALNDCHAAYCWLLEQGIEANNIVVAGDSAGGNLALATLQRIRAEGKPLPSCAVLLSPFLDFTLSGKSALGNVRHDPIFTLAFAIGIRGFYAEPDQHANPEVSPLFGDFAGLPPMLFQVGSSEMLLDDSTRAVALAGATGVSAQLEIWEQMPHVFQAIAALPQARVANQSIVDFISRQTGWRISSGT